MKRVITYGTYDLLHYRHIELLSSPEKWRLFNSSIINNKINQIKRKKSYYDYEQRKMMLESIRYVI